MLNTARRITQRWPLVDVRGLYAVLYRMLYPSRLCFVVKDDGVWVLFITSKGQTVAEVARGVNPAHIVHNLEVISAERGSQLRTLLFSHRLNGDSWYLRAKEDYGDSLDKLHRAQERLDEYTGQSPNTRFRLMAKIDAQRGLCEDQRQILAVARFVSGLTNNR